MRISDCGIAGAATEGAAFGSDADAGESDTLPTGRVSAFCVSAFSVAALPFEETSASRAEMSSPFLPVIAIASPSAAVSPAPFSIFRSVPPWRAVISIVALSVSTSARVSLASNESPSFLTQRDICPSSIVGDSFGIKNFSAINYLVQNVPRFRAAIIARRSSRVSFRTLYRLSPFSDAFSIQSSSRAARSSE